MSSYFKPNIDFADYIVVERNTKAKETKGDPDGGNVDDAEERFDLEEAQESAPQRHEPGKCK